MPNQLKNLFLTLITLLTLTSCSGGGSGGVASIIGVDIVVVDGYIGNAHVIDSNSNVAKYKSNGTYTFTPAPIGEITVSGGVFEDTGLPNTMTYKVSSSSRVISPITSFLHKYPHLKQKILIALGINSTELLGDFIKSNKIDIAKLAQLMYVMNTNNLEDDFANTLTNDTDPIDIDDIFAKAKTRVTANNPTRATQIQNFLDVVKAYAGSVTDFEVVIKTEKENTHVPKKDDDLNNAPVLNNISNIIVTENDTIIITPTATDADGDVLTYTYTGWMTSNRYTTTTTDAGSYTVTVTVSDGNGGSDSQDVTIIVNDFVSVQAGEAKLNFSDIISGPAIGLNDSLGSGAIVTVWGNNLGSSQSTSKIYFKDSLGVEREVAYVYYWKNADGELPSGPADLYSYHKMQEIAFSIPQSADGLGEIYIVTDGLKSNNLPFTVRDGNIYYVKVGGDNSTGDGSWGDPWATVGSGTAGASTKMIPGDIVYIGNGVEEINPDSGYKKTAITLKASGTADKQLAMVAYPGAAILAQAENFAIRNFSGAEYWVISKYVAIAGKWNAGSSSTSSVAINTFKGGRLVGNRITDREEIAGADGCAEGQAGSIVGNALGANQIGGVKVFGNHIHDWGCDKTSKFMHTTYFSNRSYANKGNPNIDVEAWELAWNLLKDNKSKNGLHSYDENLGNHLDGCGDVTGTIKIHSNVVVNQKGAGIATGTGRAGENGTTCWSAPIEIYNNLLLNTGMGPAVPGNYQNKTHMLGITVRGETLKSHINIYNNTIYGYGNLTEDVGLSGGFVLGSGTLSGFGGTIEFVNNIIYNNKELNFAFINEDAMSTITRAENNVWFNSTGGWSRVPWYAKEGVPTWDTSPIVLDPLFVDPVNNDFRLQANSPAINTGSSMVSSEKTKVLFEENFNNQDD